MHRRALLLACLAALGTPLASACGPARSDAASFAGRWEGGVEHQEARLATILDLHADGDRLRGTISSPDELQPPRPLGRIAQRDRVLRFELPDGPDTLRVHVERRGDSLVGQTVGGELRATLRLARTGSVPEPPFTRTEVRIPSTGAVLAGTLLMPHGGRPVPGVVLLTGSGPGPRSSLLPLADAFARAGMAVLAYDKRGDGASTGDWRTVPFPRLADDALAAVRLLRAHPGVDSSRVGLWGGSEGGMVAPLAAAASRDVAFVVLVSSLGVTAGEQDLERIRRQMTADGHDAAAVAEAVALRRLAHDVVRGRRSAREYDVALATVRGRPWARQPGFVVGPAGRDYWWTWYRSKIDLDPTVALRAVRVPALVIFGESDLVVDAARNAPLMEAALRAGGNRDVTVRIFPRADHNLRIPGGRQPDGRFDFARVAPGFLALMTEWIRRH